jgi:tetratricopeptide (TPR) repeat protein
MATATKKKQHRDAAELAYRHGVIYLAAERMEEALSHLRRATDLDPLHADAFHALGMAMETLGNPLEALGFYGAALAAKPNHGPALEAKSGLQQELSLAQMLRAQTFTSSLA